MIWAPFVALKRPPIVVEAEAKRAEVVAALMEREPPPTALRMPLMVVEPVLETWKRVVVAVPRVEEEMLKSICGSWLVEVPAKMVN